MWVTGMHASTLVGRCRRVVGTGTLGYSGLSFPCHLLHDVYQAFGRDQVDDAAAFTGQLDLLIAIALP